MNRLICNIFSYCFRGLVSSQKPTNKDDANDEVMISNVLVTEPSTSASSQDGQPRDQGNSPPFKVPKWFQVIKKN